MLTPHLRDIAHALILVSNKNGIYLATGTWGELWTRVVDHEVQRDAPWPVPYHLAEVPEAWELFAEANTARRGERNKIRKLKPVYAEEFLNSIRRSAESIPRRAKELLTWEDATFVREDR